MKSNTEEKKSWFSRMKVAIAAFAFVGAVIAGGVAVSDAPDETNAETTEVAARSVSYRSYVSWW